ncbi:MAG TPA: class I SAM-dependent methyltransferase family protein [Candidatus Saccharimonadales bacterium]|nr:class I SAM-dependent methyltransferase family protein [Candidatus Saccharimonadales bacterium]
MTAKQPDFQNNRFNLSLTGHHSAGGLAKYEVNVEDRYHRRRYLMERRLFAAFTNQLQHYLAKRPHIDFDHPRNFVRRLVYLPPGIRAWSAYMPGGLATYSVHNPEHKRLAGGRKVDYMTRALFRHSTDALGIRSRAYVLSYLVAKMVESKNLKSVKWLSLASGSGQPVYDTLDDLPTTAFSVVITDHDQASLDFAKQIYKFERPHVKKIDFVQLDVLNGTQLERLMDKTKPDLVDAMGLFEYLRPAAASGLLRRIYERLPKGAELVFTNMSSGNPHRDLHQRGLGWPGVIVRSINEVAGILDNAGIPAKSVEVYSPTDRVYNIYRVIK